MDPLEDPAQSAEGARRPSQIARRGRQPTNRPSVVGVANRPDPLGNRGRLNVEVPPRHSGSASIAASPYQDGSSVSSTFAPPPLAAGMLAAATSQTTGSSSATATSGATSTIRSPRVGRDRSPDAPPGPQQVASKAAEKDNQYLHNTLTSEVVERGRGTDSSAVVDVGVEDLNDLAHMEVLDEVRQWEDRIVSQHMVALQEDARLLTLESELLSQVQQTTNYDIDSYVSQVDDVVRRKMQVYSAFLEELDLFKAQLRREETLSQSVQRNRPTGAVGTSGQDTSAAPRAIGRELAGADATNRTPRTPRPAAGSTG